LQAVSGGLSHCFFSERILQNSRLNWREGGTGFLLVLENAKGDVFLVVLA